eukprot:PITA_36404
MCVDYRALNKITMKNQYPLSRIDELLDQLKNVVSFTNLDLRSSYHQVRIVEKNIYKTAFKTKQGLFEWMVMPFRLCNAPTMFMRCEFGKTSLIYLGHIVGNGQLKKDPSKVEAIMNWLDPTNVTEVRTYLDVVHYWRRFIANFSVIASPLHALTSVKQVFQWGGKQQKSFDILKENINTTPVLALPDLQQPFEIETNANRYAMGILLMQQRKLVSYHSETFSHAIVNYPNYDRELYAFVLSVKKWKHYLIDKETIIHMDH